MGDEGGAHGDECAGGETVEDAEYDDCGDVRLYFTHTPKNKKLYFGKDMEVHKDSNMVEWEGNEDG